MGAEIDGDHHLRAHGATQRYRYGIHDAAVDHVATVAQYGPEQSRDRTGSANGVGNLAVAQPELLPRRQIGGDRGERHRQFGKLAFDELPLEHSEQAIALEYAAPQSDVEEPDDTFHGE